MGIQNLVNGTFKVNHLLLDILETFLYFESFFFSELLKKKKVAFALFCKGNVMTNLDHFCDDKSFRSSAKIIDDSDVVFSKITLFPGNR